MRPTRSWTGPPASWSVLDPTRPPPAQSPGPPDQALGDCRVALVSNAGLARRPTPLRPGPGAPRPLWSVKLASHPSHHHKADVGIYRLHIGPAACEDLDCVLPLRRLQELAIGGLVGGRGAPTRSGLHPPAPPATSLPPGHRRPHGRGAGGCRGAGADVADLLPVSPTSPANVEEAQSIASVSLSMVPEFTASVGAPRVAGLDYPFGRPLGLPSDQACQRTVLQAALEVLVAARGRGRWSSCRFRGPETPGRAGGDPPVHRRRAAAQREALAGLRLLARQPAPSGPRRPGPTRERRVQSLPWP